MLHIDDGFQHSLTPVSKGDEIATLHNRFVSMTNRLHSLVIRNQLEAQRRNDLEMDLLIAQINPHFLYNALNSICYLARQDRVSEVDQYTRSLINLLMTNLRLNETGSTTTIETEVKTSQLYVNMASIQYPGRFVVYYDIDPSVVKEHVPRNIIQPLIENSIYHGILPVKQFCHIWVHAHRYNSGIEIIIRDDGIGIGIIGPIDGDFTDVKPNQKSSGMGISLVNISKRIDLLYKNQASIQSTRITGSGTCIKILLP
jgi:two-component system sensor histidine kinase YesM